MKKLLFIPLFALLIVGCDNGPMQKLASDKLDPTMTPEFWAKEQKNNTKLWQDGLAYCGRYQQIVTNSKPNCEVLIKINTDNVINSAMKKAFHGVESKKIVLP